jgi:hypothetical protein
MITYRELKELMIRRAILAVMLAMTVVAFMVGLGSAAAGGLNTYDGISYVNLLSQLATTSTPVTNPAADGVDIRAYKGNATLVYTQVSTNAAGTNTVVIYESSTTNGTYTAVSGASSAVVGTTATTTAQKLDMQGRKRYLRAIYTPSGTGGGAATVNLVTY